MDYREFYSLNEPPFGSSLDERFYYDSPQHSRAVVKLTHAAETMSGLAVLIGDIGTGKTTISRRLLDLLTSRGDYETGLLVMIHSGITPIWLLRKIALQFGLTAEQEDSMEIVSQLYRKLVDIYEDGKKAVVLIDEANMLQSKQIMEELRGLLNIEFPEGHLITFILFGLPDMEDLLKLDEPLYQRIAIRCILEPLTVESTKNYIAHRLKVAGGEDIFTDEAIEAIHHYSGGRPRSINSVCDNALLEGFLMKKKQIDEQLIDEVAADLGLR